MDDGKQDATTGGRRKQDGCMGWSWSFIVTMIAIALFVVFFLRPVIDLRRDRVFETEQKGRLHFLQLNIEQYAVDHGGQYPPYLIGGQGKSAKYVDVEDGPFSFEDISDCPDRSMLSDPLLREGYLDGYPKNPFIMNGADCHNFQSDMNDPLRNGTSESAVYGTRFGPYCALMGNIMEDGRYTQFITRDSQGVEHAYPTFADVSYACSDMWKKRKPTPFLPGNFFYRSRSVKVSDGSIVSEDIQDYMPGVYGAVRTKGKDVIGPDPTGVNDVTPFGAAPGMYGNPNGIRDGIILVLTPGKETKGRE